MNKGQYKRYEATYGSNTKQWWIYDTEKDVFIDPPTDILKEAEKKGGFESAYAMDLSQDYLEGVANESPSWIYDLDYHYPADCIDI